MGFYPWYRRKHLSWNGDVSGAGRVGFPFFRRELLTADWIVPSWQMISYALCFLAYQQSEWYCWQAVIQLLGEVKLEGKLPVDARGTWNYCFRLSLDLNRCTCITCMFESLYVFSLVLRAAFAKQIWCSKLPGEFLEHALEKSTPSTQHLMHLFNC